ncbi:MAG: threonine synthase [Bacteroidia bacterium]|nr:threonine synthase [Bacteroidia bacterium]
MQFSGVHFKQKYDHLTTQWYGENYEPLDLIFEPVFNLRKIARRPNNLWRYREAIPIQNNNAIVSFKEGYTPMCSVKLKNGTTVWIKQEQLFTTGSYKDRGATVLMSYIKQTGITHIVQDSSGNAGASIAAYAAKAGIACEIYLPAKTSPAKILQMQAYGAHIIKVKGNRQQTADVAFEAAKKSYYASHSFNPLFFHGTKTFAYEVCEQLGWKAPDSVVIPVGNGTLLLGCFIGFNELANAGIISHIPRLIAVQALNCNPVASAFHGYLRKDQKNKTTIAEGIAITNPVRMQQILDAVSETGGTFISVSESQIATAWKQMAQQGYFIEPTSAATIAGVTEYTNNLVKMECIVSLFSGHGLKSADKIEKFLRNP